MIVLAAFWLVRIPAGLVVQWLAVFVVAVVVTFVLYEGVRRVGVLRFLFGMRPAARIAPPPVVATTGSTDE